MQFKYYFQKKPNGNVVLFDAVLGRALKSFSPSSTIEKIDETKIAIITDIGSDKKFIFDYRKLDIGNCTPEIIGTDGGGVPSIDDVILALSTDFFFLTKSAGGANTLLHYSFKNVDFRNPAYPFIPNFWFSNNTIENESDTQVKDDAVFNPIPISYQNDYPFTNFEFLGQYGVYKNTLKEESYIKSLIVDVDTGNLTVFTDLTIMFNQHKLYFHPSNSGLCTPDAHKKVLEHQFNSVVQLSKYRWILNFDPPPPPTFLDAVFGEKRRLKPNSKLSLLLMSGNQKDPIVFKTLNIQVELEKI